MLGVPDFALSLLVMEAFGHGSWHTLALTALSGGGMCDLLWHPLPSQAGACVIYFGTHCPLRRGHV